MAIRTLSDAVSHFFAVNVRNRGWEYVRSKRVLLQQGNRFYARGLAFGSAEYRVSIRLDGNQLHMYCDCESFRKGGPCKHLWAMIVEAERAGYLSEVIWAPRLELREDQSLEESTGEAFIRPNWKTYLRDIDSRSGNALTTEPPLPPEEIKLLYFIDPQDTGKNNRTVALHVWEQRRNRKSGEWSRMQPLRLTRAEALTLSDPQDRELLLLLSGSRAVVPSSPGYTGGEEIAGTYELTAALAERVLLQICATRRCFVKGHHADDRLLTNPLVWDAEPYRFRLLWQQAMQGTWQISAEFVRGEDMLAIDSSLQLIGGTFLLRRGAIGPLGDALAIPWIQFFRAHGQISIPEPEVDEFLREVLRRLPEDILHLPLALRYQRLEGTPRPVLKLRQAQRRAPEQDPFTGKLEFLYEGVISTPPSSTTTTIFHPTERKLIQRDTDKEREVIQLLESSGFRPTQYVGEEEGSWDVAPTKLVPALRKLYQAGWYIELQGLPVRSTSRLNARVRTGIDWFELTGDIHFDEFSLPLPELLKAMSQGETMFHLEDGSLAIVGEDQLARLRSLLQIAEIGKEGVRFNRNQVALLDALLAAEPEITADETLEHARRELHNFHGVTAAEQPLGFVGELREYQREGLGWLQFLQRFRFGGCLADDMGVGKTAQVLALLETRRAARENGEEIPPSLVVAPRSLIFNWQREAARFTPALRTLDFSGLGRSLEDLQNYDLILTTYGTLRRDIAELRKFTFDYAILDEAQAIKNFGSASSKAARLIHANHRLTMTGTPVENHLGELWSIFEFLNPGMLGKASMLKFSGAGSRTVAPETREFLAAGLRPFLLRRTKEQVAKELPAKMEQTLFCELDPSERKLYNELRDHYRTALLSGAGRNWGQGKMQVLEALLRLRQAACHGGLLDQKRAKDSSAKLDTLLSQLDEVLQEGHKALIFSQFTSLLALLRQQLDAQKLTYEYLDGKTKDRQTPVERFQSDPECKLFLISLKAGGTGLNLTAADYVFLLDPWWNPAVEAQAIDRAHRIGQDKPVFAYRLIAKDTVEERVLELQNSKRELASAILSEDSSLIATLQPEDLEMLLS